MYYDRVCHFELFFFTCITNCQFLRSKESIFQLIFSDRLASFSGSGNTWLRYLIEKMSRNTVFTRIILNSVSESQSSKMMTRDIYTRLCNTYERFSGRFHAYGRNAVAL